MHDLRFIAAKTTQPRTGIAVGIGLMFVAVCVALALLLPLKLAAGLIGGVVSASACFVMLVAMPRSAQTSLFGVALGISSDGAYAVITDQTPVTIANALVSFARGLTNAFGIVTTDAGLDVSNVIPISVWSFILCTVAIMGASFLVKHDD
jgi:hypothetical protein